ncbi:MAG: DNA methylase [Lachnospiraceae bacterium]|nr:DNA methylase [Lachnospiraceae bacterium]
MEERSYIAIDLKSFYASVECVERGLDPLTTNLVVADESRTDKTICLAVSPGLKIYGIPGRPRLFEVIQAVKAINSERRYKAPKRTFTGKSYITTELNGDPALELDYIVAVPRMALYMKYSTDIYRTYLKYIAPEDIHVYSCDEVFMDVTHYLDTYHMTAHELAISMIRDVLSQTGITATAGIGTNLYLCKVAMDIVAKHLPADKDGVRIAELNESAYRRLLWSHMPLTDFWRIGHGTEKRLMKYGILTMGDVAECSKRNQELLYKVFGVNAELLIDHAWGWEPCTMEYIKRYVPESSSLSNGQVLKRPYTYSEGEIIVKEMAEQLSMDLVAKRLVTDQIVLTIGYDGQSFQDTAVRKRYRGEICLDHYGRLVPKHAHGTWNLAYPVSSTRILTEGAVGLYRCIVDAGLLIRKVIIAAGRVLPESEIIIKEQVGQLDLFTDYAQLERERNALEQELERERNLQRAILTIKARYGKNAVIKGMDLLEGATTVERNEQIGGHKA